MIQGCNAAPAVTVGHNTVDGAHLVTQLALHPAQHVLGQLVITSPKVTHQRAVGGKIHQQRLLGGSQVIGCPEEHAGVLFGFDQLVQLTTRRRRGNEHGIVQPGFGAVDRGQRSPAFGDVQQVAHIGAPGDLAPVPLEGNIFLAAGSDVAKDRANVISQVKGHQARCYLPAIQFQQRFPGIAALNLVIFGFGASLLEKLAGVRAAAGRVKAVILPHLDHLGQFPRYLIRQYLVVVQVILQVGSLALIVVFPFHDAVHQLFMPQSIGSQVRHVIEKERLDDLFTAAAMDLERSFDNRIQLAFGRLVGLPRFGPFGLDVGNAFGGARRVFLILDHVIEQRPKGD